MRNGATSSVGVVAILCLVGLTFAQQRPPSQGFAGAATRGMGRIMLLRIEAIKKELGIAPEQVAAIEKLQDELYPRRSRQAAARSVKRQPVSAEEGNSATPDQTTQAAQERRKQLEMDRRDLARKERTGIAEILRPSQMQRLDELYFQQVGTAAFYSEEVEAALQISDEQRTAISSAREEFLGEVRKPYEPGATAADRQAAMAKRFDALKRMEVKILSVITAEQKAKFEQMKGSAFETPEGDVRPESPKP